MRLLFTTLISPGHLRPMVPLAWALRADGHDVVVTSPPNMVQWPQAAGLNARAVGEALDPIGQVRDRREPGARTGGRVDEDKYFRIGRGVSRWASAYVDGLLEFARGWRPDAVVHEPMELTGRLVAAALGIPIIRHRWGIETFDAYDRGAAEGLADTCARLGVSVDALAPYRIVDPCPASLQDPGVRPGMPMRYVPDNGSGVVPDWILHRPTTPRVLVTLGTMTVAVGGMSLLDRVFEALRGLDVEVVAAVRAEDRDTLGDVVEGVRVVESLPLSLFTDTCDLVIHHGGSGSTMATVVPGKPHLVLPQLIDGYDHADAIHRIGAGISIEDPDHQRDVDLLRESVTALLNEPRYAKTAVALAEENTSRPSPRVVAGDLVEAIKSY
jgi:UDP:flavonoid glycosyltransferase YjiC (YdhE family)